MLSPGLWCFATRAQERVDLEATGRSVSVKEIEISGSTAFDDEDFAPLLANYLGREVTLAELLDLRQQLTNLYTQAGYTTSTVYFPLQNLSGGTIVFIAIEGELESIEIRGLGERGRRYVERRLRSRLSTPLRISELEDELLLLNQSRRIATLSGELETGSRAGQTVLVLDVEPAARVDGGVALDNYQSPSVGTIGGTVEAGANGLFVFEDRLDVEATFTEGLGTVDVEYEAEVGPSGTTVTFAFESGDSRVVEEPFDPLDIQGDASSVGIELARPLLRRSDRTLTARVGFDLRESETFLFEDEPFSFEPGPEDGESRVSVLRLGLDYLQRAPDSAFAAATEVRIGLPVFEATRNEGDIPDGEFATLLAQGQLVQVLGRGERGRPTLAIVRGVGQFATDELLTIEQISVGGPESVRGYRTNQRVADSGFYGTVELQFPVGETLAIGPFLDAGTAWNVSTDVPSPQALVSVGGTLTWTPVPNALVRIDGGVPLNRIEGGDTLQEAGFAFTIEYDL